jgi:hypothetical protein
VAGEHTTALYKAYKRQLGGWRYLLLLKVPAALVPEHVRRLLALPRRLRAERRLPLYPAMVRAGLRLLAQLVLIPPSLLPTVRSLDEPATSPWPCSAAFPV